MFGSTRAKIIGGIIGIIVGLIVSQLTPPEGLSVKAMHGLGVFATVVVFWVVECIPDYITAILMSVAWAAFQVVPFDVAFSAYHTSSFWLTLGAFGIAAGVGKSGLLTRIANFMMARFPKTFKGQTMGLMLTGLAVTPLIPSGTTKCALMAPFPGAIGDSMGYRNRSRAAGGLFGAMYIPIATLYGGFMSASFLCYVVYGLLPESDKAMVHWGSWLLNASLWMVVILLICYVAIQYLYSPGPNDVDPAKISSSEAAKHSGPLTYKEKVVIAVLGISLILFITERLHGVNAAIVALCALGAMATFNVIDRQAFRSNIVWDALFLIGGVINLSTVFPALKIDDWLGKVLGPMIVPLMEKNLYLFMAVFIIVIYLIRFVLVSQTALITIFIVIFSPFAIKAGISPWIIGFVTVSSCAVWNVKYQNILFLTTQYAAVSTSKDGEEFVTHEQMIKLSVVFMVANLIGMLASIPLWQLTGFIK